MPWSCSCNFGRNEDNQTPRRLRLKGPMVADVRDKKMKQIIALFIVLVLSGCGLPDLRLERNVKPSEIVGTWTITEDSLRGIKRDPDAKSVDGVRNAYQIEIRGDGALIYRSLLQMPTRHVKAKGSWKLKPLFERKTGNELSIDLEMNGGGYVFSLYFTEENGKLLLWTYFGDPDSWRLEMYEKEPE